MPVKKGKIKIKLKATRNNINKTIFLLFLSFNSRLNWYPKDMLKKGTDGLKWYRNIILGEIDQGNQKTKNPKIIINNFSDLVFKNSKIVKTTDAVPTQNNTGFPEPKILETLFFW